MATIKICDICNKRIAEGEEVFEVNAKIRKRVATDWKTRFLDICPECVDKINTALLRIAEEVRKDA